jgi:hypothetical protein
MPVGVVVREPAIQPDDLAHAQILPKQVLDLLAPEARIAVRVEQAALGGQQRAFAIDVDRAAFQDQRGRITAHAEMLQH